MIEKVKGQFADHAEAVKSGGYQFVYGVIKNPGDIKVPMREVDEMVDLRWPGKEMTVFEAYEAYVGIILDLPALEAYGAQRVEDTADFPIVVIWRDGEKYWVAVRAAGPEQRYLFVGTRGRDEKLPACCRYLLRQPTAE